TILVRDGKAVSVVVLPSNSDEYEKKAAQDLVQYFEKISGAKLETATADDKDVDAFSKQSQQQGKTPIFLGRNVLPHLEKDLGDKRGTRGAFALKVGKDVVMIAGPVEGTYYGVIELLEQQGVRWFMPGDLGEVVPSLKTIEVKEQTTIQAPSFPSRWFQMPNKEWQERLRCGGTAFAGGHGIKAPPYALNKKTGKYEPEENAEYYSLVKGQRVPRQHCVSNPKLIEYVANGIIAARQKGRGPVTPLGPNDGAGFCECPNCRALDTGDFDKYSGEMSVTDRYIWFFNRVLEKVQPEYPDTKVAFYIYHSYMRPPLREKPNPNIQGALAPIALDRVHGFSNPIAPEKQYVRTLYQEWGKLLPELYDRGYWSNLADPGFTFIIIDRLRDEIPACYDLGVKGWRVETFPNYGPQFPSMYIAGKLMWNHKANVDALLQDCYDKFFGPAAEPMGKYITLMDAALRDSPYNTGSAWDIPNFYPPALRKQARALLDDGDRRAAGKGIYADRVKMITETFDMTDHFCNMMEARSRVDFITAKAELDKQDEAATRLMNYKPVPMLSAGRFSTYVNYMKRFFRGATEQGYARITGGNQLVAAAKDEWLFRKDEDKKGEESGWWKADAGTDDWQTLKTSSLSWSDQGLRYYKGLAWYRQTVDVPEKFVGKRVFLWCGGADETAKVWVNGKAIGISPGAAFYPFEMDATDAVKPGRNVIVMCVSNQVVNEIGTGGIVAPVILYAPAKGAEATLENIRDLKPTFP
ncbi:MAG TPA: DUF4838 domain-containing protein, partial [Abditibacteriaceae bacterium]|nr:DUF4838 domain-containing protein [Abditibacteriaceae bacterium]